MTGAIRAACGPTPGVRGLTALLLVGLAAAAAGAALAAAAPFPALSGRVVDEAGLLSPETEAALGQRLAEHERATTNQVVVVTLKSLHGNDIADYGYRLGRHWAIGQKGKDNGVLLIVAPAERALRIEVGYGLEGTLTDALSRDIIERVIKPRFRRGEFEAGIVAGVAAILAALDGAYRPAPPPVSAVGESHGPGALLFLLLLAALLSGFGRAGAGRRGFAARLPLAAAFGGGVGGLAWLLTRSVAAALAIGIVAFVLTLLPRTAPAGVRPGGLGGGFGGGGLGGGGFSGGGGSFGGGGASGRW